MDFRCNDRTPDDLSCVFFLRFIWSCFPSSCLEIYCAHPSVFRSERWLIVRALVMSSVHCDVFFFPYFLHFNLYSKIESQCVSVLDQHLECVFLFSSMEFPSRTSPSTTDANTTTETRPRKTSRDSIRFGKLSEQ